MKLPWKFRISIMTKNEERYFGYAKKLLNEKNTKKKRSLYEKQLKELPDFVRTCLQEDGELPPIIPCRDELPELYKRVGDWKNAERVIKQCIECNAYHPDNGNDQLVDLLNYQKAATAALILIEQQPGILQKDIYKALKPKDLDDYSLKQFIRYSLQIKKVPERGTNKLYRK